ncbi:MAG TPA: DinB family protein [Vicinamibacterales bacterium]|nr:DinB family protein [Vicinamibacterales bacterium]
MASDEELFEQTLQAWTYAREGAIAEFENIPADRYEFKPSPASRSVAELAQHIIESGLMAAGELSRPDGDFTRQDYVDFIHEYAGGRASARDKSTLVSTLRRAHDEALTKLRGAGAARLLTPIMQFNGTPAPRLIWLHHAIAHEEYHRGQAALYARLLGLVPALTKLIQGQD